MKLKSVFWIAAGVAAVCLTACGKPPASSSSMDSLKAEVAAIKAKAAKAAQATAPNACTVLTDAIAKKYLGADAQLRRDAHPNPHMSQCQYGGAHGVINVMSGPWDMVNQTMKDDKPIPGLGDEAHVNAMGLYVRKGDHGLDVGVMTASGEFWGKAADNMEARNKAAAEKVAADLVAND